MRTEMLDRVARTVCDVVCPTANICTCNPGTCCSPMPNSIARAVLAAIEEPTEEMVKIGSYLVSQMSARDVWLAMAATALGDG